MAEKTSEQERRKARLARQLRENLKRRKTQLKARRAPAEGEKAG